VKRPQMAHYKVNDEYHTVRYHDLTTTTKYALRKNGAKWICNQVGAADTESFICTRDSVEKCIDAIYDIWNVRICLECDGRWLREGFSVIINCPYCGAINR